MVIFQCGVMYWLDWILGWHNRFYSIGDFECIACGGGGEIFNSYTDLRKWVILSCSRYCQTPSNTKSLQTEVQIPEPGFNSYVDDGKKCSSE